MGTCNHDKRTPAMGVITVKSNGGKVECHGASYYCAKCVNGARRTAVNAVILAFWESQGVARSSCPRNNSCPEFAEAGKCALGWHARDMVNGGSAWLPFAGQDSAGRADRVELSHIRASRHGAYCCCNLLPEDGAANLSRGDRDIPAADLSPAARALLSAWPAYFLAHVARKASLARLGV